MTAGLDQARISRFLVKKRRLTTRFTSHGGTGLERCRKLLQHRVWRRVWALRIYRASHLLGAAVADQRAANSTNPSVARTRPVRQATLGFVDFAARCSANPSVACRTGRVLANTPMPSRPPSSLVLPSIVW